MKTLTLIMSCCVMAAAVLCPRTLPVESYDVRGVHYIWEINVTHSGASGNMWEDHWLYTVHYIRRLKDYVFWPYNPEVFVVRRREHEKPNCNVSLQNGIRYIVGYQWWNPNFVWVRPKDDLRYEEKNC
ncbi:hypothetical protein Y032_0846g2656 [Ancylostoma ceylanicum]|uniref:Uncharacterized protein n=1 Tax=Ancylostoma ceylanicum TaxID=53326 RepID=A0A016WC60_9BILA|nr:hypothetical protein Y032_0846g2656 [Ancylostoma ceylanicum]